MKDQNYSEIEDTTMGAPHVVILGAGASLAGFPDGDKKGNQLPLMNNLVSVCNLEPLLKRAGIEYVGGNFEELYSELYAQENDPVLIEVEMAVFKYFKSLELPDQPTIYDLLAVSLRPKDLIATFNWDPLLWQALKRNHLWVPGPQVVFLHGNTAIGHCLEDRTIGPRGARCTKCRNVYQNTKLLYPIKEKNYNQDPYITASWEILQKYLSHAYILTIFGYSAPESDVEAIRLMKDGWGPISRKELAQTEIIDIKDLDEMRRTWSPFIHTHHYEVHSSFDESIMARHPRRSCEAMWAMLMDCHFIDEHPIPETQDWRILREWFDPRIEAEKNKLK